MALPTWFSALHAYVLQVSSRSIRGPGASMLLIPLLDMANHRDGTHGVHTLHFSVAPEQQRQGQLQQDKQQQASSTGDVTRDAAGLPGGKSSNPDAHAASKGQAASTGSGTDAGSYAVHSAVRGTVHDVDGLYRRNDGAAAHTWLELVASTDVHEGEEVRGWTSDVMPLFLRMARCMTSLLYGDLQGWAWHFKVG